MFTFLKHTALNLIHVLLSVFSLVMVSIKRAIGVLTQSLNGSSLPWTALFWKRNIFFPSPTSCEGETTAQSPPLPNWLSQEGPELDHSSLPESTPELGDTDHLVQSSVSTSQPEPDTVEYPEEHTTEVCESELSPGSNNLTTEPISLEVSETGQYVLPPRNNRGIPPRRYDPEFEAARSRYPVANVTRGERLSPQLVNLQKNICSEWIPKDATEAQKDKRWVEAMETEMDALEKNKTWEKCWLPKGKRPVGCKWVFTIKYKSDGTVDRYKARLVAKGYTQTYGVDYSETFSPVAKIDTIRVLFSLAANLDWPLHQFDVKNAFLHGDLEEEVYIDAPPGFMSGYRRGEVCRLRRALYGLKQSPRAWFGRFTQAMKKNGYRQSNSDHTLFLKRQGRKITCLIIYVDDMIITGDDVDEIKQLRDNLFQEFEMKDLGMLKYFLGIEVLRSNQGILISQRKYILDLLTETGMIDCKPVDTPVMVNHELSKDSKEGPTDKGRYQRLVGKLIYLSHTRPDVAYAVSLVSQFMHDPKQDHMEAALRIIRYLKGTAGMGMLFKKNGHFSISGYTDASWAGDLSDRRSTSGYFTFVGGNLVTWKSKKQKVVALSSAEAEFRGIAKGLAELLWIRKLMFELGFPSKDAAELRCDNKAAISISENPVQHDRTKHVEIDRHFIKEKLDSGLISLPFVRSEDQWADILTKAVAGRIFHEVLGKLGMLDPHEPT